MSEFGNNFDRAQRAYDNMEPPDYYTRTITCQECEGTGKVFDDGAPDAVPITCPKCKGEGEKQIDIREKIKEDRFPDIMDEE